MTKYLRLVVTGFTLPEARIELAANDIVTGVTQFSWGNVQFTTSTWRESVPSLLSALKCIQTRHWWQNGALVGQVMEPKISIEKLSPAAARLIQEHVNQHMYCMRIVDILAPENGGKTLEVVIKFKPKKLTLEAVNFPAELENI